jgi:hypothetical protein
MKMPRRAELGRIPGSIGARTEKFDLFEANKAKENIKKPPP